MYMYMFIYIRGARPLQQTNKHKHKHTTKANTTASKRAAGGPCRREASDRRLRRGEGPGGHPAVSI